MPKQMGFAFGNTRHYPYLSVAATSTHDMSTIRGWWLEDKALTQRYWSEVLHREGLAEKECSGNTAAQIIEREMLSGSMFAILPLQDWLAIDERLRLADPDAERINIPADPNHYWRYRMHLTLEQLISEDEFNERVRSLVALR
jgi:4-alpha-glucanotransferase